MRKVILIGAGHLAFHFYRQFLTCREVNLIQWYNRSLEKIDFAQSKVAVTNQLSQLKTADLYLICVSDDAIKSVSENIQTDGLIVHCAGGVPLNRLSGPSSQLTPLEDKGGPTLDVFETTDGYGKFGCVRFIPA